MQENERRPYGKMREMVAGRPETIPTSETPNIVVSEELAFSQCAFANAILVLQTYFLHTHTRGQFSLVDREHAKTMSSHLLSLSPLLTAALMLCTHEIIFGHIRRFAAD